MCIFPNIQKIIKVGFYCIVPIIQKIIKVGFTYRLLYVGITEGKIAECRALKENIVK